MVLPDVNVLIHAFREGAPDHIRYKAWLDRLLEGDGSFGMADLVLAAVVRILTNPRIFDPPVPPEAVLRFVNQLRQAPNCISVSPGARHWDIFLRLCRETGATGNLVTDAYLAALAIESGCEWITEDRDYGRFAGLRTRRPLQTS